MKHNKIHKNKYVREGYILFQSGKEVNWNNSLEENKNKIGRPYEYPNSFITFSSYLRFILKLPFRQLQGSLMSLNEFFKFPKIANYSTFQRRIIKKAKVQNKFLDKNLDTLIVDSSGMTKITRSEYILSKHRTRRPYKKIHFGVNEKGQIIIFSITDEKNGSDSKQSLEFLKDLEVKPKSFYGDGAYDTYDNFEYCYQEDIKPVIPIRSDAIYKWLKAPLRSKELFLQRNDFDKWKKENNYNLRQTVERTFSSFKRRLGSSVRSLKYEEESLSRMVESYNFIQSI